MGIPVIIYGKSGAGKSRSLKNFKEDEIFLVNVIAAVHRHNGLLKASVMSASNEHRLGAGEAPPTIISTFLGTQISEVLDKIEM